MSEVMPLSEVIQRLARTIRDEAYPEFKHAPPPEWAYRAARAVNEFYQPRNLVAEARAAVLREVRAEVAAIAAVEDEDAEGWSWISREDTLAAIDRRLEAET